MYVCINIFSCINVCIYEYVIWPLQTKIPSSNPGRLNYFVDWVVLKS